MAIVNKREESEKFIRQTGAEEVRDKLGMLPSDFADDRTHSATVCCPSCGIGLLACHYMFCPLIPHALNGCNGCKWLQRDFASSVSDCGRIPCHLSRYTVCLCTFPIVDLCICCCNHCFPGPKSLDLDDFETAAMSLCHSYTSIQSCCCLLPSFSGRYLFGGYKYRYRGTEFRPPDWRPLRIVAEYPVGHTIGIPCAFTLSAPVCLCFGALETAEVISYSPLALFALCVMMCRDTDGS